MKQRRIGSIGGIAIATTLVLAVGGCSTEVTPIIDPAGPITLAERDILFRSFLIMMIVVLPVFWLAFWFSWRYRDKARRRYEPNWDSRVVDAFTWIVPFIIWISLAVHVWIYTHDYDPYLPVEGQGEPLEIQVIAQDWKWLFIYPEQGIASVNEMAFPVNRPLTLRITSDTVMNSFFIPALGSQIYAMAGMQSQLNLIADKTGRFRGRNMQYSGDGFADQYFDAVSMTEDNFEAWIRQVQESPDRLDADTYEELAKPSSKVPVTYYASSTPGLYRSIIERYDNVFCAVPAGATTPAPQALQTADLGDDQ